MLRPDDVEHVHECSPDPPERGPTFRVVWPRPGAEYRCVCLSGHVHAFRTHWMPSTQPCIGIENGCVGCRRFQAKRWQGYLAAWETVAREQVIVSVSPQASRSAGLRELRQRGVSLRGVGLCFRRVGLRVNSAVRLTLWSLGVELAELPAAGPILPTLLALWGLEDYSPPIISLWKEGSEDEEPKGRDTAGR